MPLGARVRVARRDASPRTERGIFSFVEILLATLILALSATSTAYWVETVNNLNADADEQTVGVALVKTVEAVVGAKAFRELSGAGFGPESGETLATYDDIDDFHGLASCPPFGSDFLPLTEYSAWTVRVTVQEITLGGAGAFTQGPLPLPGDGGAGAGSTLRGVTVAVERSGREVTRAHWLRARSPFE